jgi:hypothetical protein
MLKYLNEYESVSDRRAKTLRLILSANLVLLNFLLVIAKLVLLSSGLK